MRYEWREWRSSAGPDAARSSLGSRDDEAMNRRIAPATLAPPAAAYDHAVLSEAPAKLLHTSGVVPTRADGTVPDALRWQLAGPTV